MKSNLKKAALLLTGLMVGGKLFAQTPDTTAHHQIMLNHFQARMHFVPGR